MWSGKCPVGEMSVRGNVLVGKCPVGEVSFGEVSGRGIVRSGECPLGKCPSGKCQSGNCPVGELSAYRPKYASDGVSGERRDSRISNLDVQERAWGQGVWQQKQTNKSR